MDQATPEEIAWAAGLFEGEGCFTRGHNLNLVQVVCRLNMTDLDIVMRFNEVVGVGRISPMNPSRYTQKQAWAWQATTPIEYLHVFQLLEPWLGQRRQARAIEILEEWYESVISRSRIDKRNEKHLLVIYPFLISLGKEVVEYVGHPTQKS